MKKYLSWIVAAGFAAGLVAVLPAFASAATSAPSTGGGAGGWGGRGGMMMHGGPGPAMPPGVFGTVASESGNTLTVTQKLRPGATSTPIVYTVDATNAKVMKNGTSSTVSAIATGDTVMVQGTVTGTNVAATVIRDGIVGMMGRGGAPGKNFARGSSTPSTLPIQGNGEPVVGGSITAISGNTLTVTNASNVTYSVDATNAKILKNGTTTAITSVATGDNVVVQGTVNGASVTASSVLDQGSVSQATGTPGTKPAGSGGFLGAIGGFFKHLFGF
jgi:hypothetical protein